MIKKILLNSILIVILLFIINNLTNNSIKKTIAKYFKNIGDKLSKNEIKKSNLSNKKEINKNLLNKNKDKTVDENENNDRDFQFNYDNSNKNEIILRELAKKLNNNVYIPIKVTKLLDTDTSDNDNILKFLKTKMKPKKLLIKNINIISNIKFCNHKLIIEIKDFKFKCDIFNKNIKVGEGIFSTKLIFHYDNDSSKIFTSPYILNGKYGIFKIVDLNLINFINIKNKKFKNKINVKQNNNIIKNSALLESIEEELNNPKTSKNSIDSLIPDKIYITTEYAQDSEIITTQTNPVYHNA